jgi:Flp pilus assembly protein TadG
MVEFALVLPIFLISIIAIIEFAFAFSTMNSLNFAARDLALVAAEGGNQAGSDCSALLLLEREFGASSNPSGIVSVGIYWSDGNGNVVNNATNLYNHTGSMVCTDLGGVSRTLPYTAASITYDETSRCSVLNGCPSPPAAVNHPTLDTIGVRITYQYAWKTPLANLIGILGSPVFTATQQMRMEPIL